MAIEYKNLFPPPTTGSSFEIVSDWLLKVLWHKLGRVEAWTRMVAGLTSGWGTYGAGYDDPYFYKDPSGRVHIKGTIKNGTIGAGNSMYTLPVGYRPTARLPFMTTCTPTAATPCRIDVLANGNIEVVYGTNTMVNLNGISFRAEQ